MNDAAARLNWRQVHFRRPLDADRVTSLLRQWSTDRRSGRLVLETRSDRSGVRYLLGGRHPATIAALRLLPQLLPGSTLTESVSGVSGREPVQTAMSLSASTRHRGLRSDDAVLIVRAVLTALTQVRDDEELVLQLILGPRRVPLAIPTNSPSSVTAHWWDIAWGGNGGTIDSEKRAALRSKVADHGFACVLRLGVRAETPERRRRLLSGVLAALRTSESAGLQISMFRTRARLLNDARGPWHWPLRLGVPELTGLLAWPLGDDDLPGQPAAHPRLLPPAPGVTTAGRVVAAVTAPGMNGQLRLDAGAALHHLHVLGPTGTGKSTLLAGLIAQDIQDGRAVVVIEPKGDLVTAVLGQVPDSRRTDVVILDPLDAAPIGLNPLAGATGQPELVADRMLSLLRQLYGTSIGPRSADILYASLLTLAHRGDASLVMLPLLLTNPGFRRSITASVHDPISLGPFWAQFEAWSDAERSAAVAPALNKLRPLLRPNIRAVLGQREPRFQIRDVFTKRRILLAPLQRGVLGPEAASLIGSLLVSELWQATLARSAVPEARRHPVMIYIDEVQDFLRLPVDLGEGLAQARGLGVGFTMAHQYLSQLPPEMRSGVLTNARSRVLFQLAHDDAVVMSKGHPELEPADLTSLPAHHVYASLYSGGQVTPYASGRTLPPLPVTADVSALRRLSRDTYGQPLSDIEAGFADLLAADSAPLGATGRRRRSTP